MTMGEALMIRSPTHQTKPSECCGKSECETGLRNNYYEGKRLSVDSFRIEQKYALERRRLLNRSIHGWGVVYGYGISFATKKNCGEGGEPGLAIGAGLALDRCGRELLQTETWIGSGDVIFLDEKYAPIQSKLAIAAFEEKEKNRPRLGSQRWCWQLSVHYAERNIAPVTVADQCRCEHDEWDHTCETVRYTLRLVPWSECCKDFACDLHCECGAGPCCDELFGPHFAAPPAVQKRGGCRCLCDHLTGLKVDPDCCSLRKVGEPPMRIDPWNGVPLACVELVSDHCDGWTFRSVIEDCGPRRLVKRNDLLFDLIRGCDLTRISEIGWADWHRSRDMIPFDEFSAAFGVGAGRRDAFLTTNFWVKFSRPVRQATLRPDCFAMTVMTGEREGGWWQTFRVPIVDVDTSLFPSEPGDPNDHVRSAAIVVDKAWVEDAVRGYRTIFHGSETRVELEVRGDFIVDCNGQTVDANAVGLAPHPSGNGAPGGVFLSTFTVAGRDQASRSTS